MEAEAPAAPAEQPQLEDDSVYLVPYRWWRETQEAQEDAAARGIPYAAAPPPSSYGGGPMRLINNIFNSDLVFQVRRHHPGRDLEDEVDADARAYALIPVRFWYHARRHNALADVYTLMLRISVTRDNIMTIKCTKKDNVENYKRACKIFCIDSEPVRIWDFSGQIDLIFMNEWNRTPRGCQRQSDQEILLELQVFSLSETMTCKSDGKREDLAAQQSRLTSFSHGNSFLGNGSTGNLDSDFRSSGNSKGVSSFALTGLENLGNTCFMNSAIQCLTHTAKLVEYFLGDYTREINPHNPLGMDGEIALAFGDLLRKLWSPDRIPVVPRVFKGKLARFAPQFSGFNQHDSQELLAFLLDGLHEDLNRVKCKPYIEANDASGRPDKEVADEYWANHLSRNNSIIVDLCQGQYRSTLVCPVCSKVSITFDPFMYLSLPLPSTTMRTMTVAVFSGDGSSGPSYYTINVPKYGKCKDLIQSLSMACSLKDDESLLVAEVYSSRIIRYLEEPSDSLSLIRDEDRLAAYRLPKEFEKSLPVVFTHQSMGEHYIHGKMLWKAFGVPLLGSLPDPVNGSTLRDLFLKLMRPFLQSKYAALDIDQDNGSCSSDEIAETGVKAYLPDCEVITDGAEGGEYLGDGLQFYLTDHKSQLMHSKIEMNEPVALTGSQKQLYVMVCWQDTAMGHYEMHILNHLPEVHRPEVSVKRSQDSISLYACLEAFLKEEPLGPQDMWHCPSCKKHQQAIKKLDLWRLPEVLVIHLKRFSYSRSVKNKLESFVDFPIRDLNLSTYIAHKTEQPSYHYVLYGVINHYGSMGGGHYTAYVCNEGEDRWYDFDDRHVSPITEDGVKTSAAYCLFYRRVETDNKSET